MHFQWEFQSVMYGYLSVQDVTTSLQVYNEAELSPVPFLQLALHAQ